MLRTVLVAQKKVKLSYPHCGNAECLNWESRRTGYPLKIPLQKALPPLQRGIKGDLKLSKKAFIPNTLNNYQ
jgi:hypothetical protein